MKRGANQEVAVELRNPTVVVLGLALILYAAQCAIHWGTLRDDAYITFRYGMRLADGQGLTFNPGQAVEGYTNFSWVLLSALGAAAGVDLAVLMPALGAVCGFLLVVMTAVMATRLAVHDGEASAWTGSAAALLTALLPSTAYYAVTGLETTLYALLFLGAVWALTEERAGWFCAATFCAFLTRPEAGLLGLGGVAWLLWRWRRSVWRPVLALAVATAGYLLFKLAYFGSVLPNTVFAKPPDGAVLWRYVQDGGTRLSGIIVVGALLAWRHLATRVLAVVFVAHTLAVGIFGADWMPALRMLVPILPVAFVLADRTLTAPRGRVLFGVRVASILVTAGSVLLWGYPLRSLWYVSARVRSYEPIRTELFAALQKQGVQSLGTVDIGLPSYLHPEWRILDLAGLTDAFIGHQPGTHTAKEIPDAYLEQHRPDAFCIASRMPPRKLANEGFDLKGSQPVEEHLLHDEWFHRNYRYSGTWALTEEYFNHVFLRREAKQTPTAGSK